MTLRIFAGCSAAMAQETFEKLLELDPVLPGLSRIFLRAVARPRIQPRPSKNSSTVPSMLPPRTFTCPG